MVETLPNQVSMHVKQHWLSWSCTGQVWQGDQTTKEPGAAQPSMQISIPNSYSSLWQRQAITQKYKQKFPHQIGNSRYGFLVNAKLLNLIHYQQCKLSTIKHYGFWKIKCLQMIGWPGHRARGIYTLETNLVLFVQ